MLLRSASTLMAVRWYDDRVPGLGDSVCWLARRTRKSPGVETSGLVKTGGVDGT